LDELVKAGVLSLVWSGGGEPTTHPYWTDVLTWADEAGLQQGMYTLGGLLTEAKARHASRLLKWVVVSLDCADRDTYAAEKGVRPDRFDAAIQGARWLAEPQSAVVGISFLLHDKNWFRIGEMLSLSRSLGATYTTFRPTIITSPAAPSIVTADRSWVKAALPDLRALQTQPDVEIDPERFVEYRDWKTHGYGDCLGIRLNTTITPDGRVWICPQRRGVTALGDLRRESFAAIWARHPRHFAVDDGCRVSCRLHPLNQALDRIEQPRAHEDFL
jgi:MoaA/NifB/PqqE/SkfB family radical SAM enzyme